MLLRDRTWILVWACACNADANWALCRVSAKELLGRPQRDLKLFLPEASFPGMAFNY